MPIARISRHFARSALFFFFFFFKFKKKCTLHKTNFPKMTNSEGEENTLKKDGVWSLRCICLLLFVDILVSTLTCSPLLQPWFRRHGSHQYNNVHYTFSGSLYDLMILSLCRVVSSSIALVVSFFRADIREQYPFDIYHPDGTTKKTRDELEEEALQQSFRSWLYRYVNRSSIGVEVICFVTTVVSVGKCLIRLNYEMGFLRDRETMKIHYWLAFLFAAIISAIEMIYVDTVCISLGKWGDSNRCSNNRASSSVRYFRNISSHLSLPLLANNSLTSEEDADSNSNNCSDESRGEEGRNTVAEEESSNTNTAEERERENRPGLSDIGGDAEYKASWYDLMRLCAPDASLIALAFVFLVAAATMQIYIPRYTGAILDALGQAYSSNTNNDDDNNYDDDGTNNDDDKIQNIPGFMPNVRKLIIVSILGGIFSGLRGTFRVLLFES